MLIPKSFGVCSEILLRVVAAFMLAFIKIEVYGTANKLIAELLR